MVFELGSASLGAQPVLRVSVEKLAICQLYHANFPNQTYTFDELLAVVTDNYLAQMVWSTASEQRLWRNSLLTMLGKADLAVT